MALQNRSGIIISAVISACAVGAVVWMGSRVESLRNEVAALGVLASLIRADIDSLNTGAPSSDDASRTAELLAGVSFKTEADVVAELEKLKEDVTAEDYARVAAEIDGWPVKPDDEEAVRSRLAGAMPAFRAIVKSEVVALQDAALMEKTSALGSEKLDEAGRRLALYPMSEEESVKEEARALVDRQATAVTRLDGLRRQRYNQWALIQVARAMDFYNDNAKRINPLADNSHLIDPLAEHLGVVDPQMLEPAVADLYAYVVGETRDQLSDVQKVSFAKRLVDPETVRKSLGDF